MAEIVEYIHVKAERWDHKGPVDQLWSKDGRLVAEYDLGGMSFYSPDGPPEQWQPYHWENYQMFDGHRGTIAPHRPLLWQVIQEEAAARDKK